MQGTISVGNPKEKPYLQTVELKNAKPEDLRILSQIHVGDEFGPKEVQYTGGAAAARLENAEDKIDWYTGKTPWGKPVVTLSGMFGLIHLFANGSFQAVPFFGATEINIINGPIVVDTPYIAANKIICIGAGDRTEFCWLDCTLHEKGTNRLLATLRHMHRYMKAGSPLYTELK